jgi:uncharacterized protein YjbI with pentapeptide repeats
MADYHEGVHYNDIIYEEDGVNFQEFEACVFNGCDFGACTFLAVTFIDCTFNDCNFVGTNINYVALRTVHFNGCNMAGVNFAMCDKLIFDVQFTKCSLDLAKFYTLKIKGTMFNNCSMVAVDLMSADLTGAELQGCDLHKAVFKNTIANKTNFTTATNYSIDPKQNKIKHATFSRDGIKGLLQHHQLNIS